MFASHPSRHLEAYLCGELNSGATAKMESHIADCGRCRSELEQIREGMTIMQALPLARAPDHLWAVIESALDRPPARGKPLFHLQVAAGVAAILALAFLALWYPHGHRGEPWEVRRLAGSPSLDSGPITETAVIHGGEWIETDGRSRARIQVGEIGSVDVEPNTRVTVVTANPKEHRLALHSGEIAAQILAPPRLFFVETPSGTAVDLGCEYTLRCDNLGVGTLQVQAGWVSFEFEGRESLVPAGAVCHTRPGIGPGTPYFEDAPEPLVEALDTLDFHGGGDAAVSAILSGARTRDTLTLWHLLSRVDARYRVRVYERTATLSPPPEDLSRQKLLALDPESLTRWRQELAWTW